MHDRHRPVVRTTLTRLAIGGAAGIATLLAAAPGALANTADDIAPEATTEATPTPETSPSDPAPTEATPAPEAAPTPEASSSAPAAPATPSPSTSKTPKALPAARAEVEPDFGFQKFRIGVQVADGSWVPSGTTTTGSTFTITETGPNVDGEGESPTRTFTCTTVPRSQGDSSKDPATFCDGGDGGGLPNLLRSSVAKVSAAAATGGVTVDPDTNDDFLLPEGQIYTAQPGSTVTIAQTTAAPNLVKTSEVATIAPCELTDGGSSDYCPGQYFGDRLSTVRFTNIGLPPKAVDDAARTRVDTPVAIDVLANDDTVNGAPLTGIKPVASPSNGTIAVNGEVAPTPTPTPTPTEPTPSETPPITESRASSVRAAATGPAITYTPRKGFTGQDTFSYEIATPNGTATATVTVTVTGDATPTRDRDGDSDEDRGGGDDGVRDDGDRVLPDAGGFDAGFLLSGVGLLTVGGALTVAAGHRQRRAARV